MWTSTAFIKAPRVECELSPSLMHDAAGGIRDSPPSRYQIHAIIAWAFWALFPFSRLVPAWSIPLQYLGRPYILYRRRYAASSTRPR